MIKKKVILVLIQSPKQENKVFFFSVILNDSNVTVTTVG